MKAGDALRSLPAVVCVLGTMSCVCSASMEPGSTPQWDTPGEDTGMPDLKGGANCNASGGGVNGASGSGNVILRASPSTGAGAVVATADVGGAGGGGGHGQLALPEQVTERWVSTAGGNPIERILLGSSQDLAY